MDKDRIKKAIEILRNGGIIIFPTDTAFGIGCRIDNDKAIERLFKIRKRPENQATPVLVNTFKMAQDFLLPIPKKVVDLLIKPYWPGALTIVLPCKIEKVPNLVRGKGINLGVRIPNHSVVQTMIKGVGVPILGPSANFHGEKTPYKFKDLNPELVQVADYVVSGECLIHQASTVIDCSVEPWKILREGAIEISNLKWFDKLTIPSKVEGDQKSNIKKDAVLIINTSSNEEIVVGLKIDGKEDITKEKIGRQKAQVVLPMVEKLLKKHKLNLSDLTTIEVDTGPGSFTGLRVGISIANTLAFTLNIPVNEKKKREFVEPEYE